MEVSSHIACLICFLCCLIPRAYGWTVPAGTTGLQRASRTHRASHPSALSSPIRSSRPHATTISLSGATTTHHADVVVIGGGHAGCEAAAAAARSGAQTVLVTQKKETVGEMSCNPSIGGIGKGHLVREVDALDGLMGRVIDQSGIHFRMLNARKGPAVQGPRAQADRDLYKESMQGLLADYPNLEIVEASAEDLLVSPGGTQVEGVALRGGGSVKAPSVVITAGTFLRGKLYVSKDWQEGGRFLRQTEGVESPAVGLALALDRLSLPVDRLKTGTPPRIDGSTIDYSDLETDPSDRPPLPFSYLNQMRGVALADRLVECHKTHTNPTTHDIVARNSHLLPDYETGGGEGAGPRYCPSLFKKIQRFPDRESHLVWLEPEGLNTDLVYPNGISSAFPVSVQVEILRSMKGLEAVELVRPGYDVEYDFIQPTALHHSLQTKALGGLYLAGQIIGTTGYEEAAALGIMAGINAARSAQGKQPFEISRAEGYIGVLIDDLVTKGTKEPYRMFTSRAEYRLSLRADNADQRLTRRGFEAGVVSAERLALLEGKEAAISSSQQRLQSFNLTGSQWLQRGVEVKEGGQRKSASQVLSYPRVELEQVEEAMRAEGQPLELQPVARDAVLIATKYGSYLERQNREINEYHKNQNMRIPETIDYSTFAGLSTEEVEKLELHQPATISAAAAIPGITPNSMIYLYQHVRKLSHKRKASVPTPRT